MATVRSVDFLPEIFQTDANKQFLAATLDQLIQEPNFRKTQGLSPSVLAAVSMLFKFCIVLSFLLNI